MKSSIWLSAVLTILASQAVCAVPASVEVQLFQAHRPIKRLIVSQPIEMLEPQRQLPPAPAYRIEVAGGRLALTAAKPDGNAVAGPPLCLSSHFRLRPRQQSIGLSVGDHGPSRHFSGIVDVSLSNGGISIANKVPARQYIYSVVGSETNPQFSLECLRAQSVLAQTLLARYRLGDYLPDTTESQAYLGSDSVRPLVRRAVDETWGQTLTFHEAPITAYWHSTCAGGTSDGERYFQLKKGGYPYLHGVECSFCRQSPFWKEKRSVVPVAVWKLKVSESGQPVEILSRDERQRPLRARLSAREVSGYELWMQIGQKLGWDKVPGTRYAIRQAADAVTLTSTGAGHGVGLCQWGANGMAALGKTYLQILQFYFPGTTLKKPGGDRLPRLND